MVVLCAPAAAEPRTVRPEVETLSAPKTLTASGNGEFLEGIQALHFDCSTMRSNFLRESTQMGQMVEKSAGSTTRTTSSTKASTCTTFVGSWSGKSCFDLSKESVDGVTEMGAKDCCGKSFTLENALGDLEESEG